MNGKLWTQRGIPIVNSAKREILADIASGRVPPTVASFSELHDYVDANEYGGACDEESDTGFSAFNNTNEACAFWNRIQTELDYWIRAGGLHRVSKGDEVRLRPEYQDAGDGQFRWFAIEDEDGGRVKIQPLGTGMVLPPVQVVETRMILRIGPSD